MINFHEEKIWQDAYVALMDLHEALGDSTSDDRVVNKLLDSAEVVASTIADALTRADRRVSHDLIYDAIGEVAITRTQLAIAWGQELLDDNTFKGLDEKYANLSSSLQSYK